MPGTADDLPGLVEVDAALELTTLLLEDRTTFRSAGSLTTPPCTEGVTWMVCAESITVGRAHLATYQAVFAPDARPIQLPHGRAVRRVG
jgi:carbonic anhydrase